MTWKPDYVPPKKGKGAYLSDLQKRFIDEYLVDLKGSEAVLRAGYKTKNANRQASELLNHPLVRHWIDKRLEEKREKCELSAEYVIQKLINIVESTDKSNPQAALRGLELLGKTMALFKERQEVSGPDGEAIQMEQKVQERAADFTSKLSRLALRGGTDNVVGFPDRSGEGGA